ncbi:MAG: AgmX/PglI C-terminal domain-containing protein [Deltaproteobacteria bacterium]|nr:MAG: AgmX/PglI C-terminal domain-containing protein [Deltaproteobacteria bacterium]
MRTLTLIALLLASAAAAADSPPQTSPPQGGAGGDGATKVKAASMIIEEEVNEPPPPAPVGDERRIIGEHIREKSATIQDCYAGRLRERPTLQGKLVARFDIGPSGKVIGATADGIQDPQLLLCVVKAVRQWEFQKPASGGKLRVSYPFKFEPQTGH